MSTRGRLRAMGIAAAIAGLSAGGASAVVVVGTGDPAQDVPAVQAAVDEGGIVTLSGTFDFGTHAGNHIIVPGRAGAAQDVRGQSTVFIYQSDVTIVGETDGSGNLLTTVRNGMPPFWIGWDGNVTREQPPGTPGVDFGIESLPQDVEGRVDYRDGGPPPGYLGRQTRYALAFPAVSATIQHLDFDSPLHYGIKASAGQNIAFLGNVIRDVQWGGLVHLNSFADATQIAGGAGAGGRFYAPFIYPSVSGAVTIEGNRVDDVGTEIIDTHLGECFGFVAAMTNAVLTITENEVWNVGRDPDHVGPYVTASASILFFDNHGGAPFIGGNTIHNNANWGIWDLMAYGASPSALISENAIEDCPTGIRIQIFATRGFDLVRNVVWNCTQGVVQSTGGAFMAENNTIVGCTGGILLAAGTASSFAGNLVAGNSGYGVWLPTGTDPSLVRCNDVWNNDENWSGIPDPSGTNGNFSMEPLFCNPWVHDYSLAAASPCLPGNHPDGADCGTIGALGQGCEEPVGVDDDGPTSAAAPAATLLGPWPNPSSDVLRFAIFLRDPSNVELRLFSVTGRTMATLIDHGLPRGVHSISWNLREPGRPPLPGGVYYLQLDAAGSVQTRKVILTQ